MEVSPEEYGEYWRASIRVTVGLLIGVGGFAFVTPLLAVPEAGATALGVVLLVGLVAVGTYIAVLGLARVVRVAVDAEMRR